MSIPSGRISSEVSPCSGLESSGSRSSRWFCPRVRRPHHPIAYVSKPPPATEAQRAQAVAATEHLRMNLNRGACESIFDGASDGFQTQRHSEWISKCDEIRRTFGGWKSFSVHQASLCGAPGVLVCIEGPAAFDSRNAKIHITWLLENGAAALDFIGLEKDDGWWVFAPGPYNSPRIYDAPLRPPAVFAPRPPA